MIARVLILQMSSGHVLNPAWTDIDVFNRKTDIYFQEIYRSYARINAICDFWLIFIIIILELFPQGPFADFGTQ